MNSRAVSGAMMLVARGFTLKAFGLLANIVLARLLTPEDFGKAAIGTTAVMLGAYVADSGLNSGLVQSAEPPSTAALRAFLGFQLGVMIAVSLIPAALIPALGQGAVLTMVMLCSLPLVALRGPARIRLERELRFGPFIAIEIAEFFGYYVWAVAGALLGWGVWAIATGFVVRSLFGTVVMCCIVPDALCRPSLRLSVLRPIMKFGAQIFGVSMLSLLRDQAMNVGIGSAAGVGALGLWSAAQRIFTVPQQIGRALNTVALPAMARMLRLGGDARQSLSRSVTLTAHVSACLLVPIAAAAPAGVPLLLGDQWRGAVAAFPAACLGLLLNSVAPVVAGYLAASSEAGTVLKASATCTAIMTVATVPMVLAFGLGGAAIVWCIGLGVEMWLLARAANELSGANLVRTLCPTVIAAVVGAGPAFYVCSTLEMPKFIAAVLAATGSVAVFAVVLTAMQREAVAASISVVWRRRPRLARVGGVRSLEKVST